MKLPRKREVLFVKIPEPRLLNSKLACRPTHISFAEQAW